MSKKGMTLREAFDFVKVRRPSIAPNLSFLGQLLAHEEMLKGKTPTNPATSSPGIFGSRCSTPRQMSDGERSPEEPVEFPVLAKLHVSV